MGFLNHDVDLGSELSKATKPLCFVLDEKEEPPAKKKKKTEKDKKAGFVRHAMSLFAGDVGSHVRGEV